MQHRFLKETIELSLADCQPIEFFYQFFVLFIRKNSKHTQ